MLKKLRTLLKSEKEKSVFDIIVYGSSVKGDLSPRDIDIAIIFKDGSLRERLEYVQKVKERLRSVAPSIDIKQLLIEELFSSAFFARSGVISEGYSVYHDKPFSEMLGFKAFTLFWYDLRKKTHTQKVKFNYILAGRNSLGMIKRTGAERLTKAVLKVPISYSNEFRSFLELNEVEYKSKNILESI